MASPVPENQNFRRRVIRFICYPFSFVMTTILTELHILEQFFIKLYNIYALISQMFFFLGCSLVTNEYKESNKEQEFILIGLKTLLFYSVFTYFATKTRDIVTIGRPSLFQNWNLFEGLCRIVIEWAKAIVVVVCLREQGIYFKPSILYATFTFIYYICTEKIFCDVFLKITQLFSVQIFDDLEHLYVPLLLNLFTVAMSLIVDLILFATTPFLTFTLACFYFTIYIRLKDSYYNYWLVLRVAQQTFDNFRTASQKELEEYDDICAVCLNKMSRAKITPCNHFFHPNCLKECLKNSLLCPICKLNFE